MRAVFSQVKGLVSIVSSIVVFPILQISLLHESRKP